MRCPILTALAVSLGVTVASAQPAPRKEPVHYVATDRASRVEVRPPGIRLGLASPRKFALLPLSELERARLAGPGTRLRTGIHRDVPAGLPQYGAWQSVADGTRVWRVALQSPGSLGLRVEFRNFSVGTGQVWLHNGAQFVGPYTGNGPYGDGHFWSAGVAGDSLILEYEAAANTLPEIPPFEIAGLTHQARRVAQTVDAPASDGADFCQLDASCYSDWQPAKKMVGLLTFEDGGSEYACTGSLVATRDNSMKPYLLTAGHCINNEAAARTLEVYWTYQTSSCGATPPTSPSTSEKSTLGAHLLASGTIEQGDYSLLLLQDFPADVIFSGWDPADPPVQASLVGVHHPAASWKRISFGQRVGDASADVEGDIAPAGEYLQVQWNQGVTQPGSSGSPLFSSPGVIVGTLTYGPDDPPLTACEITPNIVGYARFSNTYQNLQAYLENWPAATVTPAPASLSFSITNQAAPTAQTIQLTSLTTGQVAFKIRSDAPWISVSATNGQVSAAAPAAVKVSVDPTQLPQPGQYSGTVTILAGTAAPQFVNVTVTVPATQSNVVPAISPATVIANNGTWSFQMQLAETAGVGTHLTGLKIDGADYSANIVAWFGTDQIAAKAMIQASLQASGLTLGPHFFEFWGVDTAGNQQWYRVASATFK